MLARCCKRQAIIRLTLCQRLEFADWLWQSAVHSKHWPNVVFMSCRRRRCRANSKTILGQCFVFAVIGVLGVSVCRGVLALGDQWQRSRNARKNQPNADHRWTIVMLSPCAFSDLCWSQMDADERWEFWTGSKLLMHTSVWEETLDERWVVVTRSLYTLGERYLIAVHTRGALLDRCTR